MADDALDLRRAICGACGAQVMWHRTVCAVCGSPMPDVPVEGEPLLAPAADDSRDPTALPDPGRPAYPRSFDRPSANPYPPAGPSYGPSYENVPAYGDHKGSALGLPAHGPGSLASVGQRLAATLIDGLLFVPLSILLFVTRSTHQEVRATAGGGTHLVTVTDHRPTFVALLILVPHAIYVVVAIAVWGRTVGQKVIGLRVVAIDGGALGWNRSVRRWAVTAVGGVVNAIYPLAFLVTLADLIVYGPMLWDPDRQGLHDTFAGDVVIQDRA